VVGVSEEPIFNDWVPAADVAAYAHSLDERYGERTLRYWRGRGLLPRGRQIGGRWLYPPCTLDQLLALAAWRQRGVLDPELIRVALWVEGFPVELDGVRAALAETAAWWRRARDTFVSHAGAPREMDVRERRGSACGHALALAAAGADAQAAHERRR
jgi:hypothetical protein